MTPETGQSSRHTPKVRRNPEFTLAGLDACWNVRYRGFMNTNSTKNDQKQLFTPETAPVAAAMPQGSKAAPRVQTAQRRQIEWVPKSLDQMVESDHPVRAVWAFVEERDLTPLYDRIKAVEGTPGKSPIDPKILFALWKRRQRIRKCDQIKHLLRLP